MDSPYRVVVGDNSVYVDRWAFYVTVGEDFYPEGRFVVETCYGYEFLEPVLNELADTPITHTTCPVLDSGGNRRYDACIFGCRTYHDVRVLMNALGPHIGPAEAVLEYIFPVRHEKHDELLKMGWDYRPVIAAGDTGLYLGDGEGKFWQVGDVRDFDRKALFSCMFRLEKWKLYLRIGVDDMRKMLEDTA